MLRPFWQFLGSLRGEGRGLFLALFGKHNGHSAMAYRVLILCTGNSVRSQMAEGLLRQLGGRAFEVHSAGSKPTGTSVSWPAKPCAPSVSTSPPTAPNRLLNSRADFDTVVTVCDSAAELCPVFLGAQRIDWSIWDPGNATGSREEKLAAFCRVRQFLNQVSPEPSRTE